MGPALLPTPLSPAHRHPGAARIAWRCTSARSHPCFRPAYPPVPDLSPQVSDRERSGGTGLRVHDWFFRCWHLAERVQSCELLFWPVRIAGLSGQPKLPSAWAWLVRLVCSPEGGQRCAGPARWHLFCFGSVGGAGGFGSRGPFACSAFPLDTAMMCLTAESRQGCAGALIHFSQKRRWTRVDKSTTRRSAEMSATNWLFPIP